jgi:hypothetical protein
LVTAGQPPTARFDAFRARLVGLLAQRGSLFGSALIGVFLALSAVGPYFVFDDYVLGLAVRGDPKVDGLMSGRWDLFGFTTGEAAMNRKLMAQGLMLPWWSDEQLEIRFYRPLSSLFHRLDFALWPDSPRWMYLHSLAWLAFALVAIGWLYRSLEASPLLAGLAALLYAIDDSHGSVVSWISNRNALIAGVLGVLALLAHHHFRSSGSRAGAWLGPLCWLLALSASEFAVGTLAYLLAYTLFLDRAPFWRRAGALVPYAAVLMAWSVVYVQSGAAVRGSASYVSPWLDPARFASIAPVRISGLLAATLGPLPAELLLLGRREHFMGWVMLVALVLAAASCALWPLLRRDRIARFWLVGMLLALVPVAASFPSDRLLLLAGVGGAGLMARITTPLFQPTAWQALGRGHAALCVLFGVVHLGLAPLSSPLRAAQMQLVGRTLETATACLDGVEGLEHRTVVIVNAPLDALASYIQAERAWRRMPRPKHLYWLTTAGSQIRVSRPDANTLNVERADGFLSTPLERHYRARPRALEPGEQIRLGPMTATIVSATDEGRPRSVSFRFAEALESESYVFLSWQDDRYQPLALRTLADPLAFPAEDLGRILARTALGAL